MDPISSLVDRTSSAEAKIALFRSLFRGRDDVYPRRFESRKTGRAGYAPACANEWVRGICEKPRIKCADCSHRKFLPVTDQVVRWHLSGEDAGGQPFVAGVYPLLLDETCYLLAIDPASLELVSGQPDLRSPRSWEPDGRIVRGLLRVVPELDLVRVQDRSAAAANDDAVLEWGAGENRVLLTHDVTTMIEVRPGSARAGLPMKGRRDRLRRARPSGSAPRRPR